NNISNAPYYNAYMEMVAKHNRKITAEKEGKNKPTTAKQPKPKPAKEKSTKPAHALKPKSSFQLVDEPDEEPAHLEPKPKPKYQGEGEEQDVKRAIQMSLESFQAQGQAHVGSVAIREPVAEATQPLPVVEGKGADTDKTNSRGDTEILQIDEDQGKDEFMEEDQAGPNPRVSRVALARPNVEPTHEEFMEEPLSLSRILSLMNNLDDAHTFGDQFLNDKSTEDVPSKLNMDSEVVSMVTVLIHQASSSVPPLSTPIIDLSPPKPISFITQETVFIAITTTTTTSRPLPPPLPQQSTSDSELAARVTTLEQKLADMKEILHQRMFESGSCKSLPEHVALYEALEASMDRANRGEFFAEKDKSWKRCHDNQDPPPPLPDSDLIEDVPITDNVKVSDSEDTDTTHLPKLKSRPDWMKHVPEEDRPATLEPDWIIPPNKLSELENNWANALSSSLKTYARYGYTFLKEIVLHRADYKEYKISEDASDFLFKEDYTIISKLRVVIYRDRNDQKKMIRETEVHKFSDGTLNKILEKLDHMVKDFRLLKYNPGMTTRIWSDDDRKRSEEFMEVIEHKLMIRRIFRSLESFAVLLKVSPWKGVVCFGKKGKLAPRFVGPFEIVEKVGPVAYRLDFLDELNGVHDTFHVSNLKKCLDDPTLQVPLDEIQVYAKLNFMEEHVEFLERV
nr:hypothetical protein [Tanacetum cinerariifolium]